jgi:peptide/nickel transport system permease protein
MAIAGAMKKQEAGKDFEESYYVASQWKLMRLKFFKHKLAIIGGSILLFFYFVAIFGEFFSVHDIHEQYLDFIHAPPQKIHFSDDEGFHIRPFVYGYKASRDPITLRRIYAEDKTAKFPVRFFVRGSDYKLFGLIPSNIHFIGVERGYLYLFGTDMLGRDMFSRNIHAARISLTIGLVGVALSFILGCILGGVSGFFGGTVDTIIQRIIEFIISIPTIPLWMGLSAALPKKWPTVRIYFGITLILSVVGWCEIARVVRGKILSSREEDYALAAKIAGAKDSYIIVRHMLPSFFSYLIVRLTLAIPFMILGETSLSFLGLGMQAPAVSWGVLLQNAQNFRTVALHPWLLIPGLFVIITVLAFNFLGDGLRDAADPYK